MGPGVVCCSSHQHDDNGVMVFPSSMGWCLTQAHPTPLCLSTSGIQTRRTTPAWSARACPVTSRVSVPWLRCCPACSCGGWGDLASPLLTCARWAALSVRLSLLARWGARLQAGWSLTPHWLCSQSEGAQHHVVPTHLVGQTPLGVALDFHSSTLTAPCDPSYCPGWGRSHPQSWGHC